MPKQAKNVQIRHKVPKYVAMVRLEDPGGVNW